MPDNHELNAKQLDALREVANIGAGHAATALSQLTARTIMVSVPEVVVSQREGVVDLVGDAGLPVVAIAMHMLGDLTGKMVLLVSRDEARLLCDLLLKRDSGTTTAFGDMEHSCLKEATTVLAGAYMNGLSDLTGMMLLPSVPKLTEERAETFMEPASQRGAEQREFVLSVETNFEFLSEDCMLKGHFLLLPDAASLTALFDAIGVS